MNKTQAIDTIIQVTSLLAANSTAIGQVMTVIEMGKKLWNAFAPKHEQITDAELIEAARRAWLANPAVTAAYTEELKQLVRQETQP